jgi:hypothetical protein
VDGRVLIAGVGMNQLDNPSHRTSCCVLYYRTPSSRNRLSWHAVVTVN